MTDNDNDNDNDEWAVVDRQSAVEWFKLQTKIARQRVLEFQNKFAQWLKSKIAQMDCIIADPPWAGALPWRQRSQFGIWVPLNVAELLEQSFRVAPNGKKPRTSRDVQAAYDAAVQYGRERKAQLLAEAKARGEPLNATGANSAEDLAAEEARKWLFDKHGLHLSAGTLKKWMRLR
jgi:hypothetical protein